MLYRSALCAYPNMCDTQDVSGTVRLGGGALSDENQFVTWGDTDDGLDEEDAPIAPVADLIPDPIFTTRGIALVDPSIDPGFTSRGVGIGGKIILNKVRGGE